MRRPPLYLALSGSAVLVGCAATGPVAVTPHDGSWRELARRIRFRDQSRRSHSWVIAGWAGLRW